MATPGRSPIEVTLHGDLPEAHVAGQDLLEDLDVEDGDDFMVMSWEFNHQEWWISCDLTGKNGGFHGI
jgi:hypothetical protein